MNVTADLVLLVLAAVCFALATFGVRVPVNLIALGLLLLTLSMLAPLVT